MEEILYVFLFTFFFSLPLIFILEAASISNFLTAEIKFSSYSPKKIGLLFFVPSSFSVIHVNIDIKFKSSLSTTLSSSSSSSSSSSLSTPLSSSPSFTLFHHQNRRCCCCCCCCCCCFYLKVRVAMRFTTETRGYLKCKISPRLTSRGGRTY